MEEDEKRQEEQTVRRGVEFVKLQGDAEPLGRIVPPQVTQQTTIARPRTERPTVKRTLKGSFRSPAGSPARHSPAALTRPDAEKDSERVL